MGMDFENIRWLKELSYNDSNIIGRKAARLAQLTKTGTTIPRGFIVTSTEFFNFLQKNNLRHKISNILKTIDYTNKEDIKEKAKEIKQSILKGKFNHEAEIEIYKYYNKLGDVGGGWLPSSADAFVAVRCSVVCEDGEVCDNKFIEQEGGFLNIKGKAQVIDAIKETWCILYSADVLTYAYKKNINIEKLGIGIIIQNMILAKTSGIMISSKNVMDPNSVIIEAIYGFGGSHVIKEITPDHYETQKKPYTTLSKTISKQEWELKRIKGQTSKVNVIDSEKEKQKVNTHILKDLTNTAIKLEEYFGTPQIIEWAMDKADIYVLSSEAVDPNVIENAKTEQQQKINTFKNQLLVKGIGIVEGVVNGVVVNVTNVSDLEKINNESIIVTTMTSQEMLGAMKLCRGIVTNAGSSICHAATTSRDLKKTCIVGTRFATEQLIDGEKIQINGHTGEVYSVESLDFVDIHPEDDVFLNSKFLDKDWNKKDIKNKDVEILNKIQKEKISKKIEVPKQKINVLKEENNQKDKEFLNIKDLFKIDILKTKEITIPINLLFSEEEKNKFKTEYSGAIGMIAKEKIKKLLNEIKEF